MKTQAYTETQIRWSSLWSIEVWVCRVSFSCQNLPCVDERWNSKKANGIKGCNADMFFFSSFPVTSRRFTMDELVLTSLVRSWHRKCYWSLGGWNNLHAWAQHDSLATKSIFFIMNIRLLFLRIIMKSVHTCQELCSLNYPILDYVWKLTRFYQVDISTNVQCWWRPPHQLVRLLCRKLV